MKPGAVLSQKYRLVSLLGEGGMGTVWRAEDVRLGSAPVAIKLMHERDAQNPELRTRFDAEARIAARLRSPHVVQLYDVGVDEASGAPYLAMELLEGETLYERLSRQRALPPGEVAHIVAHVARALTCAHTLGVVHRDLKPANIFLVRNADSTLAKVLDFGVAKRATHSLKQGRTATGVLLGTPLYMSPEQILSAKDVDHRADLWSLAIIAAECLTGRLPFDADNLPGLAMQICHGKAKLPSQLGAVPSGLDEWFARATSARVEQRFASATQQAEALRALCGTSTVSELPPASGPRQEAVAAPTELVSLAPTASVMPLSRTSSQPLRARRRTPATAVALGTAAVAMVAAIALWLRREPLPPPQPVTETARERAVEAPTTAAATAALQAKPVTPEPQPSSATARPEPNIAPISPQPSAHIPAIAETAEPQKRAVEPAAGDQARDRAAHTAETSAEKSAERRTERKAPQPAPRKPSAPARTKSEARSSEGEATGSPATPAPKPQPATPAPPPPDAFRTF